VLFILSRGGYIYIDRITVAEDKKAEKKKEQEKIIDRPRYGAMEQWSSIREELEALRELRRS